MGLDNSNNSNNSNNNNNKKNKMLSKLLLLDLMEHNIFNFNLVVEIHLNNLVIDNNKIEIIYMTYFNNYINNNSNNINNKYF